MQDPSYNEHAAFESFKAQVHELTLDVLADIHEGFEAAYKKALNST